MKYLGYLPRNDPLYGYLRYDIFPQIEPQANAEEFRVYSVLASNHVYLYQDAEGQDSVIGKFFGDVPGRSAGSAQRRMEREHNNIIRLRGLGFTGYPHYVVRPLGHNVHLNCLLVEEFCYGTSLNDFIVNAIQDGNCGVLFEKYDAGAFPMLDFEKMVKEGKVDENDFTIVAEGEPIPYCNFGVTQRVDDSFARKFKNVLLSIKRDDTVEIDGEVVRVLDRAFIDGYEDATDEDFDVVREMAKRTNMPPYQKY